MYLILFIKSTYRYTENQWQFSHNRIYYKISEQFCAEKNAKQLFHWSKSFLSLKQNIFLLIISKWNILIEHKSSD